MTFALKNRIHRSLKVVYEDKKKQLAVFVMPFMGIDVSEVTLLKIVLGEEKLI